MNYEDLLFTSLSPILVKAKDSRADSDDDLIVKKVQDATKMSSFDYRIYEELKEIKKEIRQARAMNNLVKILGDN